MPRAERVEFEVAGERVVGTLRLPDGPGRFPAAVVGGPMTSVKEQVTGVYAAALARRGLAALALDHRHFGESGGEPRGYEHWGRKVEDLRAAASHLAGRPEVDGGRIGAAGVCLGSGYAAHAAAGLPLVRAVAFVAGYYRDPAEMRLRDPEGFLAKERQGAAARELFERSGEVAAIPAAATEGDAAMTTADTIDYYTRRAAVPGYENRFAVMSREHFLGFDVQSAAPLLRVPVLMVHSERALSPAWARRFHDAVTAEKDMVWLASRGADRLLRRPGPRRPGRRPRRRLASPASLNLLDRPGAFVPSAYARDTSRLQKARPARIVPNNQAHKGLA